ncbi:MAG: class A beta-lactamase [Rikenellaceae bacterium]
MRFCKFVEPVTIYDSKDGKISTINSDRSFPMQSVYKFHIALTMLNKVDQGIFSLSDSITVTQSQLHVDIWSPFRDKYPNGNRVTLAELIKYTLMQSDNNISDVIMEMVGGTKAVQEYLDSINITNTHICNYEREIQRDWGLQYLNYTTPNSAVKLLRKFHNNELLKSDTHNFLWDTMSSTYTSSIRDSLPKGTIIAHKSGFSGVGTNGILAANNDIGIMKLPNGREIIFSIFISESKESPKETYKLISQIASAIYNYY